ncbi:ATP-binding protein [Mycobacterium montefiorense]|nr:ATP-binding protein [Mycobacterium montefiorense]
MLDHWPIVGRRQEIDEVGRLFATTDGPRGVALAGKARVGKSRLAREAVRAAADAGWTVRGTAATVTSRPIPLAAFAAWTDDAEGAPHALARRVVDALTADTQPDRLLVFVDDAHLLDDLSAPGTASTRAVAGRDGGRHDSDGRAGPRRGDGALERRPGIPARDRPVDPRSDRRTVAGGVRVRTGSAVRGRAVASDPRKCVVPAAASGARVPRGTHDERRRRTALAG